MSWHPLNIASNNAPFFTMHQGKYTSANKALEYDGEWKGQFMHGQGILHDTGRGLQYSGGWVDDLMEVSLAPDKVTEYFRNIQPFAVVQALGLLASSSC
jgi:hypothetical protein